jgi:outer membrane biosynthesis protein TonB
VPKPQPQPQPQPRPQPEPEPEPEPEPRTAPEPAPDRGGSVSYENCDAARAAGAAPIYRGEPGYRSALDRNGDGVACE